jgi:hypothetical protein
MAACCSGVGCGPAGKGGAAEVDADDEAAAGVRLLIAELSNRSRIP